MTALGIREGLRCLEVGAGGGSVAAWLCEQVGPTGRVVATDINIQLLQHMNRHNFEAIEHDITVDSPPESGFDLVHTRWLLHHLLKNQQIHFQLLFQLFHYLNRLL